MEDDIIDNFIDLQSSSKAFKRAEKNVHEKLKARFLSKAYHYLTPGLNLNRLQCVPEWDYYSASNLYENYPYGCDLPRPLLPPAKLSRNALNKCDPALDLVLTQYRMNEDIKRTTDFVQQNKKSFKQFHKSDVQWSEKSSKRAVATVPKYVAEIAELVEMDPDPYFTGKYNWYYTGGTLCHFTLGETNVLAFPYMSELVVTPIVPLENMLWKPNFGNATKCGLDGELFELEQYMTNNTCRLLGRLKNECILYTLFENNDKFEILEIHKESSKVPLVSAALNPYNANQYCTVTADKDIALYDITKDKKLSSGEVKTTSQLEDNWSMIKFDENDSNVLLYTDRCCLHYLDKRVSLSKPTLTVCPKAQLEICESLSLSISTGRQYCKYLGAYHSLLLCDYRVPKDSVQQKWTHQLKSAPLYGSAKFKGNEEFIVISSQFTSDSRIIVNRWTSDETMNSHVLPYAPPYIHETLSKCHLQGKCLDPTMRLRLQMSNTGCTLVNEPSGNISNFVQNSIGDVFYQCITHEDFISSDCLYNVKACEVLSAWEKASHLQEKTVVPLTHSDTLDMQHLYKTCASKKVARKWKKIREPNPLVEPTWSKSLYQMSRYKDILAPELLAVWTEKLEGPGENLTPVTPHSKVLDWLLGADDENADTLNDTKEESKDFAMPKLTDDAESVLALSKPMDFEESGAALPKSMDVAESVISLEKITDTDEIQRYFLPKVSTKRRKPKKK